MTPADARRVISDMARHQFALSVMELCEHTPCSISSWYRTPKHNRAIGGSAQSQHCDWLAVDLIPDDPDQAVVIVGHARALGLTPVTEEDHIHVQMFPAGVLPPRQG